MADLNWSSLDDSQKSVALYCYNYLINSGFSPSGACGVLGNIYSESSFEVSKQNDNDKGLPASGLCQWRAERRTDMMAYCEAHGGNWKTNIDGQLGFLVAELTDRQYMPNSVMGAGSSVIQTMQSINNSYDAAVYWEDKFERSDDDPDKRGQNANACHVAIVQQEEWKNAPVVAPDKSGKIEYQSDVPLRTEPVVYYQNDDKWGDVPYRVAGAEKAWTIGYSGCGPTCGAMVVATLVDSSITPVEACQWAIDHGYRTPNDGTSGSFFPAYFDKYGISSEYVSSYNGVIDALNKGYMVVVNVNMGEGHYIIAYGMDEDGYILVNDPYYYDWSNPGRYYDRDKRLSPSMFQSLNPSGYAVTMQWTSANPSNLLKDAFKGGEGGAFPNATAASSVSQVTYKEVQVDIKASKIITADAEANTLRTKSNSLLDTPTLVESPFIILTIGNYTFGSYSVNGSFEETNSSVRVTYPNYMSSIRINKVNGQVNQYTITMIYQIENGNDPNLLDKVFASVGYGKVYISYGDWNAPKFAYRNEEAIITRLDSNVDFANSRITYTLYCTSNALVLMGGYYNFPAGTVKPSEEIHKMIFAEENTYHLQDIFTAFKGNEAFFWKCVAADDVSVEVVPKTGIDALSYINYLVTCMSPTTTPKWSAIRDANYYLTICEDRDSGTYFTIKKVASNESMISLNNTNVYEVDVGYPGDTLVTNFRINNDSSWALLYNYSQNVNMGSYVYNIDAQGQIYESYSPNITTSAVYIRTTETQKNWWTQMTQFPITAVLTIKGLLRPAMLMSYVRINAMFYGLRHVSSGLYIIIKQEDVIDVNGYRTTLTLQRIAGDLDVIITDTKTVTKLVPEINYGYQVPNHDRYTGPKTVAENDAERVAHAEEYLGQGVSASEAARVEFVYGERVARRSNALQAMYDAINNPEKNGISADELITAWALDKSDIDALNVTEFARGEWSGPDANWDHPEEQLMDNAGAAMQDIVDKVSETIVGTNSGG